MLPICIRRPVRLCRLQLMSKFNCLYCRILGSFFLMKPQGSMLLCSFLEKKYKKKLVDGNWKKISPRQQWSLAWELIPLFGPLSRRALNPIKPLYDPDQPDGRLNLTASAFNQLGQYTSSPVCRSYCYAELAVFFPSGDRDHRQYLLRLSTEGWPGWVGLVAGYVVR